MHDTTPAAARLVRERSLALPPERRMIQAAEMFDTARAFVLASLPEGLAAGERRVRLCKRLYGEELAGRCGAWLKPVKTEDGA